MITIAKPEIVKTEAKLSLKAEYNINGKINPVWFEVEKEYGDYLCYKRSDAFVIGVLNYAMRNGHDIKCMAPISEELHYQLTNYLIDAVYKGSTSLHKTKIISDLDTTKLETDHAVGTGISCGIDSFHTILTHSSTPYPNHNITHLTFNNVGSHGEGEKAVILYNDRKKLVKNFAREYGFKLVVSNSNIHDVIKQNHFMTHTYTSIFSIYALQKLFSKYYYASGRTFFDFSLNDTYNKDCSYYDLLLSDILSTSSLKIFSEGGTSSRLSKTKKVTEYIPSYKYLNVCTETAENCNKCEKCTRTLLSLDALGKLDNYNSVFDIDYYRKNVQKYYTKLVYYKNLNKINYVELYPLLKDKISQSSKITGYLKSVKTKIFSILPKNLQYLMKRISKAIHSKRK